MPDVLMSALLWFAALGSGLVAGVFLTFSTFVMNALSRIPPRHGMSAMQSVNATILGSAFMPLFFGTSLAALLLAGTALVALRHRPEASLLIWAGGIYFAGTFLCTVFFNVPLNNHLAHTPQEAPEAAETWSRYLREWTRWNHLRTAASTVAFALYVAALGAAGTPDQPDALPGRGACDASTSPKLSTGAGRPIRKPCTSAQRSSL